MNDSRTIDKKAALFSAAEKRRNLGENLRTIRKLHNWSLSDISKMTDMPLSSLSKVENGHASLTFEKIVVLTEALGIEFEDLVRPERNSLPPASRSITRAGTGPHLQIGGLNFEFLAAELTASKNISFRVNITNPRDDAAVPAYNTHSGEEFIFVLSGTLVLYTEHYEPLLLKTGDSITFDAGMKHAYAYEGDSPANVIMVNEKYITPTSKSVFDELRKRQA